MHSQLKLYSQPEGDGLFSDQAALESKWYAVYTRCHQEKAVKTQLDGRDVENFLPTFERVSHWKDRKKLLQVPLFPGYLFVKISLLRRVEVLKAYGAVQIVGNSTGPVAISEEQIASIRTFVEVGLKCDPHPYMKVGTKAKIKEGPLAGFEGILIRKKNRSLFVLSVDLIQRSVSVELGSWLVEPA